ncbi:MAG: head GIN domain-containing protein [Marinifilaceae bacterium]
MKNIAIPLKFIASAIFLLVFNLFSLQSFAQHQENRKTGQFESISLSVHADVYLRQAKTTSLKLEGPSKLLKEVETIVNGSTLKIRFKDRFFRWKSSNEKFKIYISSPTIRDLRISGSGNIVAETPIETDFAEYTISGSGNIKIADLRADEIKCSISGSGDIRLKGKDLKELKARISGSGDIDTHQLKARKVSIQIAGSGDCKVYASDELKARVAGSGDIYYYGNPKVDANAAGSGKIKSMNHKWD